MAEDNGKLRSADWFGRDDKGGFIHRSWMKRGLPDHEVDGRPVIGICNTWSERPLALLLPNFSSMAPTAFYAQAINMQTSFAI